MKEQMAQKAADAFMKSTGLGSNDSIREQCRLVWLNAWDEAIGHAVLELKALEKHDEATKISKLR